MNGGDCEKIVVFKAMLNFITCFIGEGDNVYAGDYLQVKRIDDTYPKKLWDGISGSLNNVWNSQSLGMSASGVDVDTFSVLWADNVLQSGDTSVKVDMYTQTDSWNLVYIVLSFRSKTETGGALSYLIRQ